MKKAQGKDPENRDNRHLTMDLHSSSDEEGQSPTPRRVVIKVPSSSSMETVEEEDDDYVTHPAITIPEPRSNDSTPEVDRHAPARNGSVTFHFPPRVESTNTIRHQCDSIATPVKQMMISVRRPVYTQKHFDEIMRPMPKHSKTMRERVDNIRNKCECSAQCMKKVAKKVFPFLGTLKGYSLREHFISDLIAGLTVGIMHIPQGMAYGMLANLPPVYGLYISFFPVFVYFFFGQSRHISMGTFAVVSLMTGVVVDKSPCTPSTTPADTAPMTDVNGTTGYSDAMMAGNYTGSENGTYSQGMTTVKSTGLMGMSQEELMCKVGYAMAANLMVGIYQLAMGLLRLGFVTIYMSEPLTRAFTTGAAVYVFTSQIKHIFGITTGRYNGILKLVYTYRDFFSFIMTANMASLLMGCICMALIYINKMYINPRVKAKIRMPFPMELIVIVLGTVVSYLGKFEEKFDMTIVGEIPSGIPVPRAPPLHLLPDVAADAIGIAIVAFAINISLSQIFGKKHNYEVPANPELVAYGITNILTSFFNCYTSAASLSRSLVQEGVGGKTQVTGLVSCCLLLVALFGLGPLFETCPTNVLAAIVIINLKGLFMQFLDLKRLWRISRYDFSIWLVTFLAVIVMDVDLGLFVGIGFSLLTVVFRTQSPYTCVMGRLPHTDIYKDKSVYEGSMEISGIKIFRFEASLYYANSEHFVNKIFSKSELNPRKLKAKQIKMQKKRDAYVKKEANKARKAEKAEDDEAGTKKLENGHSVTPPTEEDLDHMYPIPQAPIESIIVDCSAMSYIDSVGVTTLSQVIDEFNAVKVVVSLAGCKAGVREMLASVGFFENISAEHLFPSIHDAVIMALKANEQLRKKLQQDVATMNRSKSLYNVLEGHSEESSSPPVFIL